MNSQKTPSVFDEIKAFHALRGAKDLRHIDGALDWIKRQGVDAETAKRMLELAPKAAQPQPGDVVIALLYRGRLRQTDICHDCGQPLEDLPFYTIKLCVFCATTRSQMQ